MATDFCLIRTFCHTCLIAILILKGFWKPFYLVSNWSFPTLSIADGRHPSSMLIDDESL